ncbi:hypothetical protein QKT49_gp343 [Acanthamoeba castellanii medusavirus]|uniref:Uncharacterized protein n=1 Tax=Acanthamoeba castellanii medusavirus J1 TaxID=3114988 RepID=A0A3T1CX60_9VIRU|nr:hypothetical protein QKT49_gp343 [Acanthamoeba castellanii medusavirus]BBI30420.1 hypothetical protein [Acanthamoeba castellanii medusavirus J1]
MDFEPYTGPCTHVTGYTANYDGPAPDRMSRIYRALSRFFHGETLAERTQRLLREDECKRVFYSNQIHERLRRKKESE